MGRQTRSSKEQATDDSQLSLVENLSEKTLRQELHSKALQYPKTIVPATLSILPAVYLAILSSILGGTVGALINELDICWVNHNGEY